MSLVTEEETNDKVEEDNKKNYKDKNKGKVILKKGLLILFVVVLFCVFFGLGYALRDSKVVNQKEKKETNNSNSTIEDVTDCMPFYENNSSDSSTTDEVKESSWVNTGTDISKVKDVYNELQSYIYLSNRARGGLSFFEKELFSIAAKHINQDDITVTVKNDDDHYYGTVSEDKVFSTLNYYFGDNYNIDKGLNYNPGNCADINQFKGLGDGFGIYIMCHQQEAKQFTVYRSSAGFTSGPSPKIINRKIIGVYEKDDYVKVEEKVIYYDSFEHKYFYSIYSNPSLSIYITQRVFDGNDIQNQTISVDDYLDDAGTLTSIYKRRDDGTYYFVSSEISDKSI